jgi:hypothetical protein
VVGLTRPVQTRNELIAPWFPRITFQARTRRRKLVRKGAISGSGSNARFVGEGEVVRERVGERR